MSEFHVCPNCAVGLVNDDWSALWAPFETGNMEDEEEGHALMASIDAWLEIVGYLVHVREEDKGGYYDCECCGETHFGTAHVFQPIV